MTPRLTSEKNPLRIDSVAVPGEPGTIGMSLCPGKKDPYAKFGAWDRDLWASPVLTDTLPSPRSGIRTRSG